MITVKKKDQANSKRRFFTTKGFLFGALVLGSFLCGFVLFIMLYRNGMLAKLQSIFF
jgi:hypothetical protein